MQCVRGHCRNEFHPLPDKHNMSPYCVCGVIQVSGTFIGPILIKTAILIPCLQPPRQHFMLVHSPFRSSLWTQDQLDPLMLSSLLYIVVFLISEHKQLCISLGQPMHSNFQEHVNTGSCVAIQLISCLMRVFELHVRSHEHSSWLEGYIGFLLAKNTALTTSRTTIVLALQGIPSIHEIPERLGGIKNSLSRHCERKWVNCPFNKSIFHTLPACPIKFNLHTIYTDTSLNYGQVKFMFDVCYVIQPGVQQQQGHKC